MSTQNITVQGLVATTPRYLITQDGLQILSFRMASSDRKFDTARNTWVDGTTNWFTVMSFGDLAVNGSGSINKGDRILVSGALKIRDWDNGENAGTSVEIEAVSIGHDMAWGTTVFSRNVMAQRPPQTTTEPQSEPYVDANGTMHDGDSDSEPHSCSCNRCDR